MEGTVGASTLVVYVLYRAFWSPCGRRDEVLGRPRALLVTSGISPWVVPPPKSGLLQGCTAPCMHSGAEWAIGTSRCWAPSRVRGIRRGRPVCSRGWARGNQGARGGNQGAHAVAGWAQCGHGGVSESARCWYLADYPRVYPRARAHKRVVLWMKDGACSLTGSKLPSPEDTRGSPAAWGRYR